MGLDRFIFMLPSRYLSQPLWNDVLGMADHGGQTGHALIAGMHRAIAAMAGSGWNVIADHVLVEKIWAEDCARVLADLPAYIIGVQCPLEVAEERERQRRDRTLGQARLQFPVIHKYAEYDLEVDSSVMSPAECADAIVHRLASPPYAFRHMNRG